MATKNIECKTSLKKGDLVVVIAGGNKKKGKILKGQTGKVIKVLTKNNRIIVEGLNIQKRHKRATKPDDAAGIISKEGSINISNVMYYVEQLQRPVRIKHKLLEDGRKVRGYINPQTKAFEQIDL